MRISDKGSSETQMFSKAIGQKLVRFILGGFRNALPRSPGLSGAIIWAEMYDLLASEKSFKGGRSTLGAR